jgi:DNA-binding response OmpR family regulator
VNVLIVEDDESVARFLRQATAEAGYMAHCISDGQIALETAAKYGYDLILLDVMLPGLDGFTVCRALRTGGVMTPILILTARDTLEDKITGLDSGADDYIVKPFEVGELLARMRALLRRGTSGPAMLTVGDLTLDPNTRNVVRAGKTISVSATEYTLLEYLMRNAGRVLTRPMILEHVWQYDFSGRDNVLDVYISYLRSKVDKPFDRPLIHTVRGIGFRIEAEG